MSQLLLTLWFTFSALLGPGLCCCTLLSTTAHAHAAAQADSDTAPVSPCSKCCQCDPGASPLPHLEKHAGDTNTPVVPPCPCKNKVPSCASLPKTDPQAHQDAGWLWHAAVIGQADATIPLPLLPHHLIVKVFALASAQDIYVLHQLRC